MKIGINGYELVVSRFGYDGKGVPIKVGSSVYTYELLSSLYNLDNKNDYTIFLPPVKFPPDLPKEKENWRYEIVKPDRLWTIYSLSKYFFFKKPKLDVFFSPTHYLPVFTPYPSIITILDLSFLKFKENFTTKDFWQLKIWTKWSVRQCKKVFTISQASKNDILREYKLAKDKVVVTHPGIKVLDMNSVLKKYGISNNYILFVGTIQPRKNIAKLIEAFAKITRLRQGFGGQADNKNIELVIIGKPGWMYEEIYQAPKKFGVEDKVKFLNDISSEELPLFYKNALCFVLPSLYEGFGLPILEAMQNGCPVITSNVSSMPEAGGDAAVYVDPNSTKDIAEKIKKVLSDIKLREEMIKKGYEQVKKFSWEKTARETLRALEEVVKNK